LPLFSHATFPDPFTILPIPSANSPVSPLAPPPAVDPILNQTLDLPLATPLTAPPVVDLVLDQTPDLPLATPPAAPPVVDPVLDQTFDLPLAAPPADSLVSPQEPTPPVDPVTNQTLPLPLHRSDRVRAPLAHLGDYSSFSVVLSLHEPHTYCEACTNPL
jgi:hypothetical protein